MIRAATKEDIPRLNEIAIEFFSCSKHLEGFSLERFIASWTTILEADMGCIFIAVNEKDDIVGTIAGLSYPDINSGVQTALETFWYVLERHRTGGTGIRLCRRFEEWARERGCAWVRMGHLADVMPDTVASMYERLGYEKTETMYAKRINPA